MAILKHVMKGPNEIVPFDHPAIQYPQLASIKMDGFRLLNLCGEQLLSPALKEFPNRNIPKHLDYFLAFCKQFRIVTDGEFWSPTLSFQELQSIVRSFDGALEGTDIKYYIFDTMSEDEWNNGTEKPFIHRYLDYTQTLAAFPNVVAVAQQHIVSATEAEMFFEQQIAAGQEGMILRSLNAKYKHGRTTLRQDGMWKFKQFITHDAMIVGVEEQTRLKAGVERTRNELGELERRYEQGLYEPAGMVGAFIVEKDGLRFKVKPGKGHDNTVKTAWWNDYCRFPEKWHGKHIEYKYMPHGTMDKPRIGNMVRFRPDMD